MPWNLIPDPHTLHYISSLVVSNTFPWCYSDGFEVVDAKLFFGDWLKRASERVKQLTLTSLPFTILELGSALISQNMVVQGEEADAIVVIKQIQIKGFWLWQQLARPAAHPTATMREQEPMPVMSPSKLGEYTIVQEIAEGTFGKVKSAYPNPVLPCSIVSCIQPVAVHTLTGHKVAMKFISKHVINMTRTKNRVQREVEYMRTLRHAHIIKLSVRSHILTYYI